MLTLDDELDQSEYASLDFLPQMVSVDLRDIHSLFRESLIERIAPSEYRDIIVVISHNYAEIRDKILRYHHH